MPGRKTAWLPTASRVTASRVFGQLPLQQTKSYSTEAYLGLRKAAYIGVYIYIYVDPVIMEKKMETIIQGLRFLISYLGFWDFRLRAFHSAPVE